MRIACLALAACTTPFALQLPAANAPVVERRSAYRWTAIAHVGQSHRGSARHAVLADGRVVHDATALAAVVPAGSITATSLDRYRHDGAITGDWALAAVGTMFATSAGVIAEAVELDDHRGPIMAATAIVGVIALGLLIERADDAARNSNDDLAIAYAHYNDDLREALHLCFRDFAIVDCD